MSCHSLLVAITRCLVAARCLRGERLPCSAIVRSQRAAHENFHMPEPWSGHAGVTHLGRNNCQCSHICPPAASPADGPFQVQDADDQTYAAVRGEAPKLRTFTSELRDLTTAGPSQELGVSADHRVGHQ